MKNLIEKKKEAIEATFSAGVMKEMECSGGHAALFPEIFKLIKILLALPVGTATVEYLFSQIKLIKVVFILELVTLILPTDLYCNKRS